MIIARQMIAAGGVNTIFFGPFLAGQSIDRVDQCHVATAGISDTIDIRACSSPDSFDAGLPFFQPASLPGMLFAGTALVIPWSIRHQVTPISRYIGIRVDTTVSLATYNGIFIVRYFGKGTS